MSIYGVASAREKGGQGGPPWSLGFRAERSFSARAFQSLGDLRFGVATDCFKARAAI